MPNDSRANQQQTDDLRVVRSTELARLQAIVDLLKAADPPPIHPHALVKLVATALDGKIETSDQLMRQAVSINGFIRNAGMERSEAAASIRSALQWDGQWDENELAAWTTREGAFFDIVYSRPVRLVAKVIDLSFEYSNIFRRARVLTDIRPLFAENADSIEAAVVSFALGLRFASMTGENEVILAMDEFDVRELMEQCERALIKAETARHLMVASARIPTVISGASGNE